MDDMMGMSWAMGLAWLLGLALLTLVVVAIVWLIRNMAGGGRRRPDAALETLRQRYASGELSQEEFRRRSADLRGE